MFEQSAGHFNLAADISYASAADIDLTQPLAIGCRVVYGRSNDLYFNGAIDDVMIFDRELSSDEIKAMYNCGFSLGWDDNGNMTATDMINGTDTTLQYNWDNKLRSATKGAKSISLRYDPGGNRIWKESIDGAVETTHKYIVDIVGGLPTTLMEMTDTDNTILKTYIYANGQVLCRHDGDHSAPRYFYTHDRLGSVRQMVDTSANVVKYYTYEPFGEVLEEEGTLTNNMMFTGQYFDTEIDQYYLRARQYDPHISRFTARDPIRGKFEEPLTLHVYLYCINDPTNKIDLLGLRYWGYEETQKFIQGATEYAGRSPLHPFLAFRPGGDYDVAYRFPKDKFQIYKNEFFTPKQFGNYLAGHITYYNYGIIAEYQARSFGHGWAACHAILHILQWEKPTALFDDWDSRLLITKGALDANLKLKEEGKRGVLGTIDEMRLRSLLVYYWIMQDTILDNIPGPSF